jgi:hypothetical protein
MHRRTEVGLLWRSSPTHSVRSGKMPLAWGLTKTGNGFPLQGRKSRGTNKKNKIFGPSDHGNREHGPKKTGASANWHKSTKKSHPYLRKPKKGKTNSTTTICKN